MESEIKESISGIVDKIADDIKGLSKEYGAWVVIFLLAVYVWKKVK